MAEAVNVGELPNGRLPDHPAVKALLAWNDAGLLDAIFDRGELTLTVTPENICAALQALKECRLQRLRRYDRGGLVAVMNRAFSSATTFCRTNIRSGSA